MNCYLPLSPLPFHFHYFVVYFVVDKSHSYLPFCSCFIFTLTGPNASTCLWQLSLGSFHIIWLYLMVLSWICPLFLFWFITVFLCLRSLFFFWICPLFPFHYYYAVISCVAVVVPCGLIFLVDLLRLPMKWLQPQSRLGKSQGNRHLPCQILLGVSCPILQMPLLLARLQFSSYSS